MFPIHQSKASDCFIAIAETCITTTAIAAKTRRASAQIRYSEDLLDWITLFRGFSLQTIADILLAQKEKVPHH
jgi:hypothetical protein